MKGARVRRGILWASALLGLMFTAYAVFTLQQSVEAPVGVALMGGGDHPSSPRLIIATPPAAASLTTVVTPGSSESMGAPGAVLLWTANATTGEQRMGRAVAFVEYNETWGTYDVPAIGVFNATNATILAVPVMDGGTLLVYRDMNVTLGPWLGTTDGWLVKHDASMSTLQSPEGGSHPLVTPAQVQGTVVTVVDGGLLTILLATSLFATLSPLVLLWLARETGAPQGLIQSEPTGRCMECGGGMHEGATFCYRCGAYPKAPPAAKGPGRSPRMEA